AVDLNPNFAAAHGYIGFALACDGRSEDAIESSQRAIRMSPGDPLNFFFVGALASAHYLAGRYAEALDWARKQVQRRHGSPSGHRIRCASLAQAILIDEAPSGHEAASAGATKHLGRLDQGIGSVYGSHYASLPGRPAQGRP